MTTASATEHIDDATWNRFEAGELDEPVAARVRAHLSECGLCLERLRSVVAATMTVAEPSADGSARLPHGARLGRYVVLDLVGQGGMGEVYMARDPELERLVALKVLRRRKHATAAQKARLVHEAQAMARLSHPNVVAVHDVGVEDGHVFLTMELVPGASLRTWKHAKARGWREIVELFCQAGRGLAAAHDAGIVHRDFKPDNVLVRPTGEAKVTDFGIARGDIEPSGPVAMDEGSLTTSVRSLGPPRTEAGRLLGTPAYMAPEQHLGEPADARSDQFSFCVALYEALYDERPFGPGWSDDVRLRVLAGKVREVPRGTKVPAALRAVLLRGLRRAPAERYPSMHALLRDLERDPHARRRRTVAVLASALAAVSLVASGGFVAARQRQAICAGGKDEVRGVWGDAARAAAERAFAATGLAYATDAWKQAQSVLDAYAEGWAAAHRRACEATRLRGEQPDAVLAQRLSCLESRKKQLRALGAVLAHADGAVVLRAVQAARALDAVEACDDVELLAKEAPLPSAPDARAEVEGLRAELAVAKADLDTGHFDEGRRRLEASLARAKRVAFQPVLAETLLLLGQARDRAGDGKGAVDTLKDAAVAAEAAGVERIKAEAEIALAVPLADAARFAEAKDWLRLAAATTSRLGESGESLEERRAGAEGWVAILEGRYDDAVAVLGPAVAAAEASPRADALRLVSNKNQLASALEAQGELERARALYANVDETLVRVLGPEHPERMAVLGNQANVLVELGRCDEAALAIQKAQALGGRALEAGSVRFTVAENTLGLAELCRQRYDEALAAFQRAHALAEKQGARWLSGVARLGEGHVALERGAPENALVRYDDALATLRVALSKEHPYAIEALAGRGRALAALGRTEGAVAALEEALALLGPAPPRSALVPTVRLALARALKASGAPAPRSRALAEAARDGFAALGRERERRAAVAWLEAP